MKNANVPLQFAVPIPSVSVCVFPVPKWAQLPGLQ